MNNIQICISGENRKMYEIANRIKETRKRIGMKQTDFKNKVGISNGEISKIENGLSEPGIKKFLSIAEALGVDITWLATGHYSRLSTIPHLDVLELYNQLDQENQEEIKDLIELKLKRQESAQSTSKEA